MRWWSYLLLGLLAYLFFATATIPAQQLLSRLPESVPVQLGGIDGTVWSGKTQQFLYQSAELGPANWSFHPLSLLLGRLGYNIVLQPAGHQLNALVTLRLNGDYQVEKLIGTLPARDIPEILGYGFVGAEGNLDLDIQRARFSENQLTDIQGELRWSKARLENPMRLALGDIQADLSSTDQGLSAILSDLGGPLKINGGLTLSKEGRYEVDLKLKPGKDTDPGLVASLKALGRQGPGGVTRIKLSGNL
jgi:general secretion pathway protein N